MARVSDGVRSSWSSSSSSRLPFQAIEDAVWLQEWGCELGQGREAADGAGGDDVVGLAAVRGCARSSERVLRTVALGIPASAMARLMKSHLRPTDSIRSTWALGRATARARPGKPAPAPTSAIRAACAQLRDLEAGEAVGDVDLPGALVDDGADRGALLGEQLEDLAQRLAAGGVERRGGVRRSLRDEGGDDYAAAGLVALAVGLDPGALLEALVDDAALLGAHRVHLDDVVGAQRLLGGAVGAALERLAAALAVAGGVDDDPFALAQAAEGGLVAEQLQGVDRLAPFADQQAVVVLALDVTAIRSSSSSISTSPSRSSSSSTPSTSSRTRSAGVSGQSAASGTGRRLSDLPPVRADN